MLSKFLCSISIKVREIFNNMNLIFNVSINLNNFFYLRVHPLQCRYRTQVKRLKIQNFTGLSEIYQLSYNWQ